MSSLPFRLGLQVVISLIFVSASTAQSVKQYSTEKIQGTIKIDGLINEDAWKTVSWEGGFIQTEPENGAAPTLNTQFKIVYDASSLYVAIRAFDQSPDSIVVTDSPRDFFDGDYVEINIDSNFDRKTAYSFTATAGGIRGDEYIKTSDNWENDWNPAWKLATQLDELGWVAEFKIPFSELNYYQKKESWGIQINRSLERLDEGSSWSPIPDEDQWVAAFGLLSGIRKIPVKEAPSAETILDKKAFISDLKDLKNTLTQSYPSLHRYRTEIEIDQFFDQSINQISTDLSLLNAYKITCSLLSKIGDGHMQIGLPDKVNNDELASRKKLPFKLLIKKNGTWIKESYGSNDDFLHSQLLSINGRSMNDIASELINYIPSDGLNQTGKYFKLSENFNFYYSLISDNKSKASIRYRKENGAFDQEAEVALLTNEEIEQSTADTRRYPFELSYQEEVAVIRISTFNYPQAFKKFVDESFKTLEKKQTKQLVLDFRGNGGGDETNAIHLYSYPTTKPFRYYDRYEVSTTSKHEVKPFSSLISYETTDFLATMTSLNPDSTEELSKIDRLEGRFIDPKIPQLPHKNNQFEGEVIVLIDGGSFSATSELCAIMKRDRRVTFVGEETGGTFDGNTSGIYDQITLPNSGIKIRIPLIKYVSAVDRNSFAFGRGIIPDHTLPSTVKEGEALKFALGLFKSR